MRVFDAEGTEVDATFDVETFEVATSGVKSTIFLHSRGGTKDTPKARNSDYARGLEILLERLKKIKATIETAHIATARTRDLSPDQTQLNIDRKYPFSLTSEDIPALRRALSRAQTRVGQTKGAKGGNATKSIRVRFVVPSSLVVTEDQLSYFLATGNIGSVAAHGTGGATEVASAAKSAETEGFFNAADETDQRNKIFRAIAQRQGQPAFRKALLLAYGGRCAMTGCDAEPALEAAHILPFRGVHTHHVQNGLLLRADLHTLFDRGLIAIDTKDFSIIVATQLQATEYRNLHKQRLRMPQKMLAQPNREALDQHKKSAGL